MVNITTFLGKTKQFIIMRSGLYQGCIPEILEMQTIDPRLSCMIQSGVQPVYVRVVRGRMLMNIGPKLFERVMAFSHYFVVVVKS